MSFANLLALAVAPVIICLIYMYIRDKYEKEPIRLLVTGVLFGVVITFPIIHAENFVTMLMPIGGLTFEAFYTAFITAALVEEGMKFAVLFFLTWREKNLNERFDGIVYAAFISLGFAGFENALYVFNPDLGGVTTGLLRAIISVPGHGFFGVAMGYYFALAKLEPEKKAARLLSAFFAAWLTHGVFNFIIMSEMPYMIAVFGVFLAIMWINGFRRMKRHLENSPFKTEKAR